MTETGSTSVGAANLRAVKARELDALAARTGDQVFARAACVLRGGKSGRVAIDDSRALAMADALVRENLANSAHAACEIVAELMAKPHQVATMRDRLRRKFRTYVRTK